MSQEARCARSIVSFTRFYLVGGAYFGPALLFDCLILGRLSKWNLNGQASPIGDASHDSTPQWVFNCVWCHYLDCFKRIGNARDWSLQLIILPMTPRHTIYVRTYFSHCETVISWHFYALQANASLQWELASFLHDTSSNVKVKRIAQLQLPLKANLWIAVLARPIQSIYLMIRLPTNDPFKHRPITATFLANNFANHPWIANSI